MPICQEDVYIELPDEAECGADECGKLKHWLYGCRKAGQAWEDHYADVLFQAGFERGTASPVAFWHEGRSMWCIVHRDDFVYDEDLDFVESIMKDAYEIKVRGRLGPGENDVRSIDILGRVLEKTM